MEYTYRDNMLWFTNFLKLKKYDFFVTWEDHTCDILMLND